jgi:hypothetical protein
LYKIEWLVEHAFSGEEREELERKLEKTAKVGCKIRLNAEMKERFNARLGPLAEAILPNTGTLFVRVRRPNW